MKRGADQLSDNGDDNHDATPTNQALLEALCNAKRLKDEARAMMRDAEQQEVVAIQAIEARQRQLIAQTVLQALKELPGSDAWSAELEAVVRVDQARGRDFTGVRYVLDGTRWMLPEFSVIFIPFTPKRVEIGETGTRFVLVSKLKRVKSPKDATKQDKAIATKLNKFKLFLDWLVDQGRHSETKFRVLRNKIEYGPCDFSAF